MMNEPDTDPTASGPRPAATVVILRDSEHGPEALLTVRPQHLRFMGGAWVFPGGAVASADLDPSWDERSDRPARTAATLLGVDDERAALAYHVCALREAYEEVGFPAGSDPAPDLDRTSADDPARFLVRCSELGVVLRTDQLVPAGRWVTPAGAPVRFDTQFFVIPTDPEWEPTPDPSEVSRCMWLTPAAALTELASGRALMAPPTVEMLQRLDGHDSVDEIVRSIERAGGVGRGERISTRLSPLVHVVLAPNPGLMTGPGTNTYVVGSGPWFVIDPAVEDHAHLDAVVDAAPDVDAILITHRHPDHIGGVASLVARTGARVHAFGTDPVDGIEVGPLADGDLVESGASPLRALHTPGHASDHLCYQLEGAASLFSGDVILGEGTAVIAPPDGNMTAYLASLDRLRRLHIDRIYPGHFRTLDGGAEVISAYIAHRHERERLILGALDADPTQLDEVVSVAYADTPKPLHPIARFSALAHLEKLEAEGRVRRLEGGWILFE